jgi:myxalamid-type polyketide synthase MxaE and MxaD
LNEVLESLKTRDVFCRDLGVDYAFHTPQLEPLMPELAEALRELKPRAGSVRMLSTVTGADASGEGLDGRHWARTMRDPVRFADAIDRLLEDRYDLFIEIGPSHVLGTPITECLRARGIEGTVLASLRKGRDGSGPLLAALGSLFTSGRDIDWKRVYPRGRFVSLPTYPWQRKRYWLSLGPDAPKPLTAGAIASGESSPTTAAERMNVATYYDKVSTLTEGHNQEMFLTFAPFREPVPGFSWLLALHEPDNIPTLSRSSERTAGVGACPVQGIDFRRFGGPRFWPVRLDAISLAERYRHLEVDGFTISAKQAEFANRQIAARNLQDRVSIYHFDSSKDEFPGHYDLVIGFEVAHYVDEKHQLFSNIDRHLADGGFLVLADFVANTVSEIRDQTTSSYFPTARQWSDLFLQIESGGMR